MKSKKSILTNKIKEIVIKCFLILTLISMLMGGIIALVLSANDNKFSLLIGLTCLLGIPLILFILIFIIASTVKECEPNKKHFKIIAYNCSLNEKIEIRLQTVYDDVMYSKSNPKNYYISYRKTNEVVVVAVMHVTERFCEDEYMEFMNEIPELFEHILNHTLIVIFIEDEKSNYLNEIMYAPEYNSLWDTKVYSIYNIEENKLIVNKTNSGTGNKAYNDAVRELDKIFIFKKVKKIQI